MSTGDGRKVTHNEIKQVKDLIETCILNYMKKKDVIGVLYKQHNIDPCFTRMVWQRLEEQNKEFFRNYYLRLALIDQITRFNEALEIQADVIKQLNANEVEALPPSGLNNCATLGLQHASGYASNTFLAQNPNAEMNEQGVNNGTIRINNECGDFGNISASVSSSTTMDNSNSHQMERTFTDDLLEYIASQPDGLFDPDSITVENQGGNISSSFDFQNYNNFW